MHSQEPSKEYCAYISAWEYVQIVEMNSNYCSDRKLKKNNFKPSLGKTPGLKDANSGFHQIST